MDIGEQFWSNLRSSKLKLIENRNEDVNIKAHKVIKSGNIDIEIWENVMLC